MRGSRKTRERDFIILYEDRDMIVVNKRAGILSVPLPNGGGRSVLGMLRTQVSKGRIDIVHRIDRYTSGLLVFAKNPRARHFLTQQFLQHTPKRKYLALLEGQLPRDSGEYSHYLSLGRKGFFQSVVKRNSPGATLAQLTYQVVERFSHATEVEIMLITGLKNQIRAQFAYEGFPLIGEQQYVPEHFSSQIRQRGLNIDRQALHAVELSLLHPTTNRVMVFEAPPPSDYIHVRNALRK